MKPKEQRAPKFDPFMEYDVMHYVNGATNPTVAWRAVKLWQQPAYDRLPKLLELQAPTIILWGEMYKFQPGRVPVASRPQYELLDQWKNEPVLHEEKKGSYFHFSTPKGVIAFNPKGRFGPHFKVV